MICYVVHSNHEVRNCGIIFILHSTLYPAAICWGMFVYYYTINNDHKQYNICNAWLLYINLFLLC